MGRGNYKSELLKELDAVVDVPSSPMNLIIRILLSFVLITLVYVFIVKIYFNYHTYYEIKDPNDIHDPLHKTAINEGMEADEVSEPEGAPGSVHNPLVLLVFNGPKHAREARNIIESMKKNDMQSYENVIIAISDSHSRAVADEYSTRKIEYPDLTEEGHYGSAKFAAFTKRKFEAIRDLLKQDQHVLYSDTDIVFLKPVIQKIVQNEMKDPSKIFFVQGDQADLKVKPNVCTGFMYIKPHEISIEYFDKMVADLSNPEITKHGLDDQHAFNKFYDEPNSRIKPNLAYLDFCTFPNGARFFGSHLGKAACNRSCAAMVHNNWIMGPDAKWERFQKNNLVFIHE